MSEKFSKTIPRRFPQALRRVLGAVNEYERSMISLRLRAGRLRKGQNGGYPGARSSSVIGPRTDL
jgi:DNA invertase Pin-like site-specific DNA recombinase